MRELVINKKTGFQTTLPFLINDRFGNLFYSDEFTDHIENGKVLKFNLPIGKYSYDGSFIKLSEPVTQKLATLPKPERNYNTGKTFKILFKPNPNKCSIYYNEGVIIFDNQFKTAPVFVTYYIYFHELGHLYYETEQFADMYAANKLLELGFNRTQVGIAPIISLSEKNDYRKILNVNNLQ